MIDDYGEPVKTYPQNVYYIKMLDPCILSELYPTITEMVLYYFINVEEIEPFVPEFLDFSDLKSQEWDPLHPEHNFGYQFCGDRSYSFVPAEIIDSKDEPFTKEVFDEATGTFITVA